MSKYNQPRQGTSSSSRPSDPGGGSASTCNVFFDPAKSPSELYDSLAEQQADQFKDHDLTSSQLRRFFGEIKDLYRQWEARCRGHESDLDYRQKQYVELIEPRFKMIRSKVFYAQKSGQTKVTNDFANFLKECIKKVSNSGDFQKFVLHLEAVVGFMYGKNKVGK